MHYSFFHLINIEKIVIRELEQREAIYNLLLFSGELVGSYRAIDGKLFKFTVHPALGMGIDGFGLSVTVYQTP